MADTPKSPTSPKTATSPTSPHTPPDPPHHEHPKTEAHEGGDRMESFVARMEAAAEKMVGAAEAIGQGMAGLAEGSHEAAAESQGDTTPTKLPWTHRGGRGRIEP